MNTMRARTQTTLTDERERETSFINSLHFVHSVVAPFIRVRACARACRAVVCAARASEDRGVMSRRYDDDRDGGRRRGGDDAAPRFGGGGGGGGRDEFRGDRGHGGGGGRCGSRDDRGYDRGRDRDGGYRDGGYRDRGYDRDRDRGGDRGRDDRGGERRERFGGGGGGDRGGARDDKFDPDADWRCDQCNNSNFSWRKSCKRCGAGKSKELKERERAAQHGWLLDGLEDTTNRIFIKGFDVASTSEDDLREVFSGIGIISRVKQRTGFPDQWPYAVKIYRDERGEKKDEAVITYDDPHAAQSAPSFYDGYEFNGKKLHVSIAQSRPKPEGGAPPPPPGGGGDRGDRGYDRGGGGRDYGRHRPY